MPHVTSAKWDRTLVLNILIFIAIWLGLRAALEIHFRLIIRHRVLGYRLNTYRLEVTGYSEDPWWREFYINFKLSRLQFGSRPIGPTGDGLLGWNRDGDEPPPHGEQADHLPEPSEGRPPTVATLIKQQQHRQHPRHCQSEQVHSQAYSSSVILHIATPQLVGSQPNVKTFSVIVRYWDSTKGCLRVLRSGPGMCEAVSL